MRIFLIAALAKDRTIGDKNKLPWHLPNDLRRFKELTRGHAVIMGRKTYESIGRLLPERLNVIISRNAGYRVEGAEVVSSIDAAFDHCARHDSSGEVFVIGGAEIYRQTLPRADRLYLTMVHREVVGDAFFPEWDANDFTEISREERSEGEWDYAFVVLERKRL